MRFRLLPIALVVLALTVLAAAPVEARHRDRDRRSRVIVVERSPRVIFLERDRGFSDRPHGWDRGRKVGWGNCDLPPGLAKKYGCHSSFRDRRVNRRVDQRPVVIIPLPFVRF
ncbi:MAG: hypothetical protein ACRD4U_00330, partial [Candidatus Acidiferrales bacterium]